MNKENIQIDEDTIKNLEEKEKNLYVEIESEIEEVEERKEPLPIKETFLDNIPDSHIGWLKVNPEIIPSLLYFYPEKTVFYLKPALVKQIKDFSNLIDDDSYTINEKINEMLSQCCRITVDDKPYSVKNILEIDKLFLMFAVRDLTFKQIQNPLFNNSKCPSCNEGCGIEIFSNNTTFFNFSKDLFQYYNIETRRYELNYVTELDNPRASVNTLILKPPTIKTNTKVQSYIERKKSLNQKIDSDAIKYLRYFDIDWDNSTYELLDDLVVGTQGWDDIKFSLVLNFIKDFENQIQATNLGTCVSCGAMEVSVPFRFQGNFRSIFLISNPYRYVR